MSEDDLWVVVEGRDHDRPHYEKLLAALPATRDRRISIRLAEQIDLDGVAAGGKDHVMSLHDYLETTGKLTSKNKAGRSTMVFMVDRDRDDFLNRTRESDHVFYTYGSDVEADILLNSNLWSALSDAYGVDSRICQRIRQLVDDPAASLVALWEDWLILGLIALSCGTPGYAPWGTMSLVNPQHFTEVDASSVERIRERIRASFDPEDIDRATAAATQHFSQHGVRLLKGRWIARYIKYLVEVHLSDEIVRSNVQPTAIVDTALSTLNYHSKWVREYEAGLAKVLAGAV